MNFLNVILEIASTHTKGTFVAIEYDKLFRKHCEHATAVGATDFDLAKAMHTIHKDSLEKAIANVAKAAKDEKAGDPAGSKKEKKIDCMYWMRQGYCTKGEDCDFRHQDSKKGIEKRGAASQQLGRGRSRERSRGSRERGRDGRRDERDFDRGRGRGEDRRGSGGDPRGGGGRGGRR